MFLTVHIGKSLAEWVGGIGVLLCNRVVYQTYVYIAREDLYATLQVQVLSQTAIMKGNWVKPLDKKPKQANEDQTQESRDVVFMPGARRDIQTVPDEAQDIFLTAIEIARDGGKASTAKPLKGFQGASVLEIVADYDTNTYRAVYTVQFAKAVYVLHVFQKKSSQGIKTNQRDIELIESRLKAAKQDYDARYRK